MGCMVGVGGKLPDPSWRLGGPMFCVCMEYCSGLS